MSGKQQSRLVDYIRVAKTQDVSFQTAKFKAGSLSITHIAKSNKVDHEFYAQVAETLKTNIMTETWGDGKGGLLSPNCKGSYKDKSNINMKFDDVEYDYKHDHSKFAISFGNTKNIVC